MLLAMSTSFGSDMMQQTNQLSSCTNIANMKCLCQFRLYININKIHPYLSMESIYIRLLPLVNSELDYCKYFLTDAPMLTIRPMQQFNLVFNQPKYHQITSMLHSFHWLPAVAENRLLKKQFKTLMLAYKAINWPVLCYLRELVKPLIHAIFQPLF